VGVAFDVGLDPHRVFDREADNSRSLYGRRMRSVADHVRQGGSLADAVRAQGNYFPPHFAEMIAGGESSGRLEKVLDRLADYYRNMADFRSLFVSSILWPMIQLVLAVIVVGLLIYLPSVLLPPGEADKHDLLGFGLVGEEGLVTYAMYVAAAVTALVVLYLLARNGYLSFVGDMLARIPMLGRMIMVFAEARFVQTLGLAVEAGIDAASAVDLSFRSAGTPQFLGKAGSAKQAILQGRDMHSVLDETGLFQPDTIEVVELGEASGKLAETLNKHFRHLKGQVVGSMAKLTYFASAVIWFTIVVLLIAIIFRVFSLYINNLGDAATDAINRF
jgi:type II secretory pathway component PulF